MDKVWRLTHEGILMPEFPTITHVALTVNDLGVSVPWYRQLFDADPLVDEDTGPAGRQ